MAVNIQQLKTSDIQQIEKLFKGEKSPDEIKWLFENPDDTVSLNGFKAIEGEKIVGVIGYVISYYKYQDKEFKGVIPMSWQVDPEYKGFAGVLLFKKVLSLGDFGMAIGGSYEAQDVYPVFKLKFQYFYNEYYKLIHPIRFIRSRQKSLINNLGYTLLAARSFLQPVRKNTIEGLEIQSQAASNPFQNTDNTWDTMHKVLSAGYMKWLLNCPLVDSYSYTISYKGKYLGIAIIYISILKGVRRGRIVHIPFLGDNIKVWTNVIAYLNAYLKGKGCCYISAVANTPIMKKALDRMSFSNIRRQRKPFFIKDENHILDNIPLTNWHLQYSEGDKAYRNM